MLRFQGLLMTKQVLASASLRNRISGIHGLTHKLGTSAPYKGSISPLLRLVCKLSCKVTRSSSPVNGNICSSAVSRCQCCLWHCVCSEVFVMHVGLMPGFKPTVSMPLLEAQCNCCQKKRCFTCPPLYNKIGMWSSNLRAKNFKKLFCQKNISHGRPLKLLTSKLLQMAYAGL